MPHVLPHARPLSDLEGTMGWVSTADDADATESHVQTARRARDVMTDTDHELIRLWAMAWRYTGIRDQRIVAATGLSPTRAAQRINELLDLPEALVAHPIEVNRLRRVRAQRQRR